MRPAKLLQKVFFAPFVFFLLFVLGQAGCWSNRVGPPDTWSGESLTLEEFQRLDRADAYFLVQRFRPWWLSDRSNSPSGSGGWYETESKVRLYVDGIPSPFGIENLKTISGEHVLEIRHLSPMDATTRYGTGHSAGAILVTTRAGVEDLGT
jgi:hypothetical protein